MSKLLKFNTRSEFDEFVKTNSGLDNLEDALASENNGVYDSVVFIADTGEIYANNKINTPGQGGDSGGPDLDDYALKTDLDTKVDKVEGMGLSSNDYTTDEKNKLSTLSNYDDSAVLEAIGGKQDVISDLDSIRSGAALGATAIQVDQVAFPVVEHGVNDSEFVLTPNVMHVWGEVSSLTLTFDTEISNISNEYIFEFISGATATTLTLPDSVVWHNTPSIEANKKYQISILNNIGIVISVDNA